MNSIFMTIKLKDQLHSLISMNQGNNMEVPKCNQCREEGGKALNKNYDG